MELTKNSEGARKGSGRNGLIRKNERGDCQNERDRERLQRERERQRIIKKSCEDKERVRKEKKRRERV